MTPGTPSAGACDADVLLLFFEIGFYWILTAGAGQARIASRQGVMRDAASP